MNRIAFFDFDGTITTKDTLLEIIKYQKGSARFYLGFLLYSPYLVAYKLGVISNQLAKEKILAHFFKKTAQALFQQRCDAFAQESLPALIRPKALEEIKKLKSLNADIVIVTASATSWIQYWCNSNQLQLIGTQLEVKEDKLTGKIVGKNCHGQEKVNRIKAAYDLSKYDEIYCYGDTKGDKPMLGLATFSFYQPFT
jgi:HAD superfamily hydrolase (TIGR01490 family)